MLPVSVFFIVLQAITGSFTGTFTGKITDASNYWLFYCW